MAAPINVLFLRDTSFVCGPGKTILNTYRTLDRTRFTPLLGVPGDSANVFVDRARALGMEVIRIPRGGLFDPRPAVHLARTLKRHSIDIVQSHDFLTRRLCVAAAALTGVCHVTSVHGWITNRKKQMVARRLDRSLIRHARSVVAVSEMLRDQVIDEGGVPAGRVHLLRNAIVLEDYPPPRDARTARAELGLAPEAEVISIVGRLSPEKGHDLFLEIARRIAPSHPSARFLIVGHGPLRPNLEVQARSLGVQDRVMFLGLRDDMHRVYAATDILTLCSWTEGLPNVVLEAFAYRRPVVSTRVGGVPEVITDASDGFLVEAGDVDALTTGVLSLLNDKALAADMGARGRVVVEERFDFRRRTRMLEAIYDSLGVGTGRALSVAGA